LAKDDAYDIPRGRANRHAHAQFASALTDQDEGDPSSSGASRPPAI
jgi:hypothetical protein